MAILEDTCTRAGLAVSTKTKFMHINLPPDTPTVAPLHLEQVQSFTYLGAEVNCTLNLKATIEARLAQANSVFALLRQIWDSRKLPIRVKTLICITLVRPIVIY